MKHIAVLLLVPLLLFNTIGYYLAFCGDLLEAKHEAAVLIWGHEALGEKMVSLTFPVQNGKPHAADLIFTDDDEFMYQGRMYDIVGTIQGMGCVIFKCYTDNKETALNQNLCQKINSENEAPAQNHKNSPVLKEFVKDYVPHTQQEYSSAPTLVMTSHIKLGDNEQQSYIYRAIVSPPPEFLIS